MQVPLSKLRYFFVDGTIGGPMVSSLSPEVKQGIQRVINYLEDMYGVTVKPVMIQLFLDNRNTVYIYFIEFWNSSID